MVIKLMVPFGEKVEIPEWVKYLEAISQPNGQEVDDITIDLTDPGAPVILVGVPFPAQKRMMTIKVQVFKDEQGEDTFFVNGIETKFITTVLGEIRSSIKIQALEVARMALKTAGENEIWERVVSRLEAFGAIQK